MSWRWKHLNNQWANYGGSIQAEPAKDSTEPENPTGDTGIQRTEQICQKVGNGDVLHIREQVGEFNKGAGLFAVPRTYGAGFFIGGEKITLGAWEYLPETGVFFFDNGFYAIYATNVAQEGCFMQPEVYIREFVHHDDAFLVAAQVRKTLQSATRYFSGELEHRIIRRDGQVRTIRVRSYVVRDAAGKILKCYGANQDITEQRKLEKALCTSREKYSLAAELARFGPWEYYPELNLFEFNDEFYAIYSTDVAREGRFMTPEEYASEFLFPEDAKRMGEYMAKRLASQGSFSDRIQHRIIRRDGEVRNIALHIKLVRDEAGNIVRWFGANQDVTEQVQAEAALRANREKLFLAANLARLGPWEVDPDTGHFEFGSEFYAIYGTDVVREGRHMSLDDYIREFVHPEDAWIVKAEVDKLSTLLASTKRDYLSQVRHRIIRRDGEVRTIMVHGRVLRDEAGKVIRWFGANQDITEQVQTEAALRESEQRHRATLKALPDMLFRVDVDGCLLDYRIPDRYWPSFNEVKGPYCLIDEILPVPLAGQAKEMIILTLATGETRVTEYCGLVNGRDCFLQIRTAAINKKEALVIIQNQTELYRARRECQRLERLNLVGAMAAGIGHEVRNPLTTVRGYLQFLSGKEKFRDCTEMFDLMIGELDRTNAIISEFLALSKNKAVRLEPRNLNTIIGAIYPLLAVDALEANKNISLELQEDIPPLNLDEGEIRQLIINFVRNGLEATGDKGQVRIITKSRRRSVLLIVQDNGGGIPTSIIEQIGTPFVSTKDHGTGLGLSVCYSIAARHRATIDFQTSEQGTAFTVCFPCACDH